MNSRLWILDLDGTLYKDVYATSQAFSLLFRQFMAEQLGCGVEEVDRRRDALMEKHQTESETVAFTTELGIDFGEIVANVHLKIDLHACGILGPDTELQNILSRLVGRKIVLTNNISAFGRYVLDYMGVTQFFIDVIGMHEMEYHLKPDPDAFAIIERDFRTSDEEIIFCDDEIKNLDAARDRGWKTILYDPYGNRAGDTNNHIPIRSLDELCAF